MNSHLTLQPTTYHNTHPATLLVPLCFVFVFVLFFRNRVSEEAARRQGGGSSCSEGAGEEGQGGVSVPPIEGQRKVRYALECISAEVFLEEGEGGKE